MSDYLFDYSVEEFKRLDGETDDSPRIQRAIDSCTAEDVLYIPKGEYEIASPLIIANGCSVIMHKSAILKAVSEMDYVLSFSTETLEKRVYYAHSFIQGGIIDASGLASCLLIDHFRHFTLSDISLYNGKKFALRSGSLDCSIHGGYELIANNVYCRCLIPGLAGNTGISIGNGDSHFTDCIVIDYTVGIDVKEGSTRLTRCHIWGGPVPEMLIDSVNFKINAPDAVLTDCYADTGAVGYQINGNTRLKACGYFNNPIFPLKDVTVIDHINGDLSISNGYISHLDEKTGGIIYKRRDNFYLNDCFVRIENKNIENPFK